MYSKFLIIFLVVTCLFTRFYKLDWGSGVYFHPDENNMAFSVSQLQPDNLNPHFFAYGQFPLYLSYFSLRALNIPIDFSSSILMMRFWSALFSVALILLTYLIAKQIFTNRQALLVVLLSIFTPGLIQISHFATTESILSLVFVIEIYLAIKIFTHPQNKILYFLSALVLGIGLASKISALIFLTPLILVSLMNFKIIPKLIITLCFSLLISFILSPYNLLDYQNFLSSMNYETSVATGKIMVFYTTQFLHTVPYLFQITHIFPYVFGLPLFVGGLIGLVYLLLKFKQFPSSLKIYWLLILIPSLIYFLYFGQLFTKWTRFMSPLFFVFPFLFIYLITQIKINYIKIFLLCLSCVPGIYFMNIYFSSDIRLTASAWFEKNVPVNSNVLSESGNVVNFPITNLPYHIVNYDFYSLNSDTQSELDSQIQKSKYIIVPSRRIFKNYSYKYHQELFNGQLGFKEIIKFTPNTDLFLDSENAEETWTVFDHPTIRMYQRNYK